MNHLIEQLSFNLQSELPGRKSHDRMAVHSRYPEVPLPANAVKAGVTILIYPRQDVPHVVYIVRAAHELDKHRGQISFPGGKEEPEDFTMASTALRELEEEIGVKVHSDQLIGELSPLFIPVSNFQVFPFVAYMENEPSFELQPSEVSDVIEVPLSHFQQQGIVKQKSMMVRDRIQLRNVPYFDLFGQTLWGATAMITAEFLDLVPWDYVDTNKMSTY